MQYIFKYMNHIICIKKYHETYENATSTPKWKLPHNHTLKHRHKHQTKHDTGTNMKIP
jgi:hypothetical protein